MNYPNVNIDCEGQGTLEWLQARAGNITGSVAYMLMTKPRSKADKEAGNLSATAIAYLKKKAVEIYADADYMPLDLGNASADMRRGNELEDEAVGAYLNAAGIDFWDFHHPDFVQCGPYLGFSPDGLVGDDGMIEVKCPTSKNAIFDYWTIKSASDLKRIKKEYYWQIQYTLLLTGRQWCDFIVYTPQFGDKKSLYYIRIERVEEDILELHNTLQKAVESIELLLSEIQNTH